MHAAADLRNRDRTLMAYLVGLNLSVAWVPPGDDTAPTTDTRAWVRVQVDSVAETQTGPRGGARTVQDELLITADVFCRGQGLTNEGAVDGIDDVAGRVRSALTAASLPLLDYVGDPTGATTLAGATIRVLFPTTRALPPVSGVHRRQVLAPAIYIHEV